MPPKFCKYFYITVNTQNQENFSRLEIFLQQKHKTEESVKRDLSTDCLKAFRVPDTIVYNLSSSPLHAD